MSIPNSADFIADSSRLPEYNGNDALKPVDRLSDSSMPSVLLKLARLDELTEIPFRPRAD